MLSYTDSTPACIKISCTVRVNEFPRLSISRFRPTFLPSLANQITAVAQPDLESTCYLVHEIGGALQQGLRGLGPRARRRGHGCSPDRPVGPSLPHRQHPGEQLKDAGSPELDAFRHGPAPQEGRIMIGDDGKDGFGAGRLPKALPDPAPRHPAWGHELAPELLHFHLQELWEIHLPLTVSEDRPACLRHAGTRSSIRVWTFEVRSKALPSGNYRANRPLRNLLELLPMTLYQASSFALVGKARMPQVVWLVRWWQDGVTIL